MVTLVPGAVWRPIERNFTDLPRVETRAFIVHITASATKTSQFDWFNSEGANASSQVHAAVNGLLEQYVDADEIAWASGEGNPTTFAVEFQGAGTGPLSGWQQVLFVVLARWASDRYGLPLQLMADSKPSSTGIGWHRLGVPYRLDIETGEPVYREGWLVEGGERWSRSPGKTCPGDRVIAQLPHLLTLAADLSINLKRAIGVPMFSPLIDGHVSSEYGPRGTGFHAGLDIAPNVRGAAAPVFAAFSGRVIKVVSSRQPGQKDRVDELAPYRTGNGVRVQNPDGEGQLYGHVRPVVKVGAYVTEGDLLGYLDDSGVMTGRHLHYEEWTAALDSTSHRDPRVSFNHFAVTPGVGTPKDTPDEGVEAVQRALAATINPDTLAPFYPPTGIDGIDGPVYTASVKAWQAFRGLVPDGSWGPKTQADYLVWKAHVTDVQTKLAALTNPVTGKPYYTGTVDGMAGRLHVDAVAAFQTHQGLVVDLDWGAKTDAAYVAALAAQQAPPPPVDQGPEPEPQPEPEPKPEPEPGPLPEVPEIPVPPVLPELPPLDLDALATGIATALAAKLTLTVKE